MPRRPKDKLLASLKTPSDWDAFLLKNYGLAQVSRSDKEVGEHSFVNRDSGEPLSVEEIAELNGVSHEQLHGLREATHQRETAAEGSIELSPDWERYFAVMCLIADAVLPEAERQGARDAALGQSRIGSAQKDTAPNIPSELGTPEELRQKWWRG